MPDPPALELVPVPSDGSPLNAESMVPVLSAVSDEAPLILMIERSLRPEDSSPSSQYSTCFTRPIMGLSLALLSVESVESYPALP
jgi:hypothetical protein